MNDKFDMSHLISENPASGPLVIAKNTGEIIYCNDAAHMICAAIVCGADAFTLFPPLKDAYRAARANGERSFRLREPGALVGWLIADLTFDDTENIIKLFPMQSREVLHVDYAEAAREFADLSKTDPNPRRVSELYEVLTSSDGVFLRGHEVAPRDFAELINGFFNSALPKMRTIGQTLVLNIDDSVLPGALICSDIYTFELILSALASALGYTTKTGVTVTASHTEDFAVVTMCAEKRDAVDIRDAASFGPHSSDVLFAETLARVTGSELTLSSDGKLVTFTLRVPARNYYPEWLKNGAWDVFFIETSANVAAHLIIE